VEVNHGRVEVAGDKLRAIVERIERIGEEIKELNEGKREIFQEAKSNGFDVKVIREIVRLRKQDQKEREEHESLLEIYLKAIKGSRVSKQFPSASDLRRRQRVDRAAVCGPLRRLSRHLPASLPGD
jgi:uncharacterized protein (UPF0335 family)